MINSLSKKKLESLVPLIICILLVTLIYFFNIRVNRVKARKLELAIKSKEDNIEALSQIASNPKGRKVIEDRLFKEKVRLDAIIPSKMELTKFLKDLEVLLDENQINLDNFSVEDFIIEDEYIKAPINLSFSAEYQKIIDFFNKIEEMERLVTEEKLSIIKDKGDNLKVKTLLCIYSLKEETK
ncbi:hypothetical protein U472_05435 [Orenia metallireducens]|uniref:Pilus assembly protein, PilO n=1 Tax=Orenia metallireducens TaxID=1413210 RepID=A0A1C0A9G6_9FIRM|nr:type 4a pilus biogenesis protein PilO [Orenia metallireducens]OCL26931.1 hypothetical protein U472_05435 [Orenia metallireducens]